MYEQLNKNQSPRFSLNKEHLQSSHILVKLRTSNHLKKNKNTKVLRIYSVILPGFPLKMINVTFRKLGRFTNGNNGENK